MSGTIQSLHIILITLNYNNNTYTYYTYAHTACSQSCEELDAVIHVICGYYNYVVA